MEKTRIMMIKVLIIACSVTSISATNMILGTKSGNIYICQENHLDDCLVLFNAGSGVSINALAVSEDFLYAGLSSGIIMRCERETEFKCGTLHDAQSPVHSIAASTGDYIYASLDSGVLLQCNKYEADICTVFYTHDAPIRSLAVSDSYIYAGIQTNTILRCDIMTPGSCGYFQGSGASINALALSNNYLIAGLEFGVLWRCDQLLINSCLHLNDLDGSINSLAITYGYIYVGLDTNILRCSLLIRYSCQVLTVRYDDSEVLSISVVKNGSLWSFSNSNNILAPDTKYILKSLVKKYLKHG